MMANDAENTFEDDFATLEIAHLLATLLICGGIILVSFMITEVLLFFVDKLYSLYFKFKFR